MERSMLMVVTLIATLSHQLEVAGQEAGSLSSHITWESSMSLLAHMEVGIEGNSLDTLHEENDHTDYYISILIEAINHYVSLL